MRCNIGTWVCAQCFHAMVVEHVGPNRNRVTCPECGTFWYVDNDGEYINE